MYLGAGQSEDAGCLSQQTQVLGAGQPEDAGCLHNRLRYLGLVNLRMLDVSSALSRIFLRRCTLNARKGLQRQILCRLCKSRAVLFCAESFILIFFSQKQSFWQNYFCLLIRVRFMTTKKYCGTASVKLIILSWQAHQRAGEPAQPEAVVPGLQQDLQD